MGTLEVIVSGNNVRGGELSVRFGGTRLSPQPFTIEQFNHRDNTFDIANGMPTRLDMLVQQLQRIGEINSPIRFSYDSFKTTSNPSVSPFTVATKVKQAVEAAYNANFPWLILKDQIPQNWAICFNAALTDTSEPSDELDLKDELPKALLPLGVTLVAACELEGLSLTAVDRHHIYLSVEDRLREEELDRLLDQSLLSAIGVRGTEFMWHP